VDGMIRTSRRGIFGGVAATALLAAARPPGARAQGGYPNRPVTIINPFAPGGQSDPIGRAIALHLQRALGQPFVLDNRTGAGSTIGAQYVARAAPDGHTLLFGTTSTFVIAPFVYRAAGYDPAGSFAPIAVASEGVMVLTANPRTGFRTAADVVAAAKRRPGDVTFASAGNGSLPHVLGELFASLAGIRLTHVPYRGGAPAMNDLVGGQVDLFFEAVANVAQHAEAGRIVALLATGTTRSPLLPEVPTATEAGYPDLNLTSWTGFAAPANTPAPIIAALNREINAALRTAELRDLLARIGVAAVGGSPEDMSARIARESPTYQRIIAAAKVTAD
jgi:tripartite-type tricarboxylate transporter receptor subunit TctC